MNQWKKCKLRDVIELNYGKGLSESDRKHGNIPVFGSNGIVGYHNEYLVKGPGIVIGRKGSVGQVKYSTHDFYPIDTTYFVKTIDYQQDIKFHFYFLLTLKLHEMNSHSAVPGLNRNDIYSLYVKIPPLPIQRKIASVLTAYDDLIENNNHRIAILEKMAEEIYREWFVRLRFPEHEKTKILKGVPDRWEVKRLKEMPFEIIDGDRGTNYPKKDEFSDYGYCIFLNTGNIKNDKFNFSNCQYITKQKDESLRQGKLKKDDIIITTRGTVGAIAHYTNWNRNQNIRINSGMIIIRPRDISSNYLYHTLKSEYMKNYYSLFSSGSAQPQLPIKDFKNILCLLPDNKILKKFDLKVDKIAQYIEHIAYKNSLLTTTRDRLLSRLMSGKIYVENLDILEPKSINDNIKD